MDQKPPDVVVLGAEWPVRALLRAQLIDEGYEVVAVDTWPIPRRYRRLGMKPRVLLIDLHELPKPRETLDEVRFVLPADRVLVVTALASLPPAQVRGFGFNVVERPTTIGEIVRSVAALLSRTTINDTENNRPIGSISGLPISYKPVSQDTASPLHSASHTMQRTEAEMRKEDRIREQQSQTSEQQGEKTQPRPDERVKGSAADESNRPPSRQPGKLPLPD